ncbi:MAG: AgmX/PglI C-terminal domain-containing protein [Alphaproteobacteria bacterium]|nr:AgmX/PglI C-terminal domain-containing protein [Alphaproteobacteria bacterium]
MASCPFCQSPIDGDILLYGGSCPKCFGEIPGEEAATDPGEEVKARQQKSDNRRILIRTLIPLVLAIPVVGGMLVLALGFIIWNRNPTVEVMNFDDLDLGVDYDIVSAPPELENPDPDAPKPRPVGNGSNGGERPRPRPNDGGTSDPTKPPQVVVPKAGTSSGGINFGGVGVVKEREGETLSDPGEIFENIKKVMTQQQGTLKQCYDSRLKVKEGLEGRWRAHFTVNQQGYAENVRFEGMNMSDSELETCLANTVKKWKFSKITHPQPVEKSWRFRPG